MDAREGTLSSLGLELSSVTVGRLNMLHALLYSNPSSGRFSASSAASGTPLVWCGCGAVPGRLLPRSAELWLLAYTPFFPSCELLVHA